MSLSCVRMSEDVWLTCITHALSTETEEIMGLLRGDIQESKDGNLTALIWGASPQTRSYHRKDRVETNPNSWPLHLLKLRCAYKSDVSASRFGYATKVGRIQVIAFQSSDGKHHLMLTPIPLTPSNRSSIIDLESSSSIWTNMTTRSLVGMTEDTDLDLSDSRALVAPGKFSFYRMAVYLQIWEGFFCKADANSFGKAKTPPSVGNSVADVDSMAMSESMQEEAMHRSNLDLSLSPAISALHDWLRENEIRLGSLIEQSRMLETEVLTSRESTSAASLRQMSTYGSRGNVFNKTYCCAAPHLTSGSGANKFP